MKTQKQSAVRLTPFFRRAVCAALGLVFALSPAVQAAPPALANAPLVGIPTTEVRPNLMFIMDNSGSMTWDYTPDYVNDAICLKGQSCVIGDPPYTSSSINSQYYNPAITYTPAVNSDGSSMATQTSFTAVLKDPFTSSTSTLDLTTKYPDRLWCKTSSPTTAEKADTAVCRKNGVTSACPSGYCYPDTTYNNGVSVTGAPYYYSVKPTEYCKLADLKECSIISAPTGAYTVPAYSRWCKDAALSDCQALYTSTYKKPRYLGAASTSAVAATGKFQASSTTPRTINSITVINGTLTVQILSTPVIAATSRIDLAAKVVAKISSADYTARVCNSTGGASGTLDYICIDAKVAGPTPNGYVIRVVGTGTYTDKTLSGGSNATNAPVYTFERTNINTASTYPNAGKRTDCTGSTCTGTQEMTNFSNWYAYYRTRRQAMKTSASLAFKAVDSSFRVGYITINDKSTYYLPIARFDDVSSGSEAVKQKTEWYKKLFATTGGDSTPLRSTLSLVGRLYAGLKPIGDSDPMQYSCQQNFALLTTDGYWNIDDANGNADVKDLGGEIIGDMDGGTTPRPMNEGSTASNASLADVAKYYYDTDLRTTNCTGSLNLDVCENNVFVSGTDNNVKQHMTTFTLGLGVNGTLVYNSGYKTESSGDFYDIKTGTKNWPKPLADNPTAIDDLWHAAVNGQGTYFSAQNPNELTAGLSDALSQIDSKVGSAAAAATSTLTPTAGDNFAYFPSYTTVNWTGNLEARGVNTSTGTVSKNSTWCAEDIVGASCPAPGAIVPVISGSTTTYQCQTPTTVLSDCNAPGVWDGTLCKVDVAVSCTGTMAAKVAPTSDTRTIYTGSSGGLVSINGPLAAYTTTAQVSGLTQWSLLTDAQKTAATGTNLVNYLRGQTGYEDRSSNLDDNRLYRKRDATLGDILESKPIYVAAPSFQYSDPGYSKFKESKKSRAKTVYVGANDGMLHAFNAENGVERWAYAPSMVLPNMWKLADKKYASLHTNFVNGVTVVGDACVASCTSDGSADWRTILVGGLGGGGIGYYALDITDPTSPALLWEFDASKDSNLGFTYGNPIITKRTDGTWVVLLTSGHYYKKDSTSPTVPSTGDGIGRLYVRNAKTGAKVITIDTTAGTTSNPAGFNAISAWAEYPLDNNTSTYVYGGDLQGNVWRFDISTPPLTGSVMKFAVLKDGSDAVQPITTAPELGRTTNKNRVVYVATGKYIEASDLANTQGNTLYAIQDAEGVDFSTSPAITTLNDPRTAPTMVKQTLSNSGANRTVSSNPVNFLSNRGWYVDFPDSGERVNINPTLFAGALVAITTVPTNTVCNPGGYSWFNFVDYSTGSYVAGSTVGLKLNALGVGMTTIYTRDSKGLLVPKIIISTSKGEIITNELTPSGLGKFQAKRLIWRELIPN
jgi:type IV pilus assembly protein PilY1